MDADLSQHNQDSTIDRSADLKLGMVSGHLAEYGGSARAQVWGGIECFDWYGVGDTGIIAAEGPDHDGLYIWEDAHIVEILDPETGQTVIDGEQGNICDTVLFKDTVYTLSLITI